MTARRFGKIDVDIRMDEDYVSLPCDEARLAFIYTFLSQKKAGGLIRSRAQFDELLGRYAKWLPDLVEAELVIENDDGSFSARSYGEWQSDPKPSTDRVRRWRQRKRESETRRKRK